MALNQSEEEKAGDQLRKGRRRSSLLFFSTLESSFFHFPKSAQQARLSSHSRLRPVDGVFAASSSVLRGAGACPLARAMKRHHEEEDNGAAFREADNADADAVTTTPSKRPRSSPAPPLPLPPAATGGGALTVWQPSPFVLAKPSTNGNGDEGGDPMEAEENSICPLLGRRRSASLPPLSTTADFLSPQPGFFARGAATPLAPPPLPMPPPTPPASPSTDNSMAIVLYQPSSMEVARLLREEGRLASSALATSATTTSASGGGERSAEEKKGRGL